MTKNIKRIGITGVALTLALSIAFADQIGLGIAALQDMALKASVQVKVDEMEAKVLADKLADANKLAKERENAGGTRDENLQRDIVVKVDTLAAKQQTELQKSTSIYNEYKRRADIEIGTMDLYLANVELDSAKKNTVVFEREVAVIKRTYQLGQVTALQVLEKENALLTQRQDVITLEQQVYQKTLELERLVGEPLKGAILIDYSPQEKPLPKALSTNELSLAVARQLAVIKAQNARDVKQLTFDLTLLYYYPEDKEYKSNQYDLEVAKFDLQSAKQTEEIALVFDYEQLKGLKRSYELEKEYVLLHEQRLADVTKKKQLGAATELEVLNAQLQLRTKRVDAQKALGAYLKALVLYDLK